MKINEEETSEKGLTFFEEDSSDEEFEDDDDATLEDSDSGYEMSVKEVLDHHQDSIRFDMITLDEERRGSSTSYLTLDMTARPPIPQSRWSASTIQTLESYSLSRAASPITEHMDEEVDPLDVHTPLPNFSCKSATTVLAAPTPKRPVYKLAGDSLEKVVREGGWKRRGVVFQEGGILSESD